VLIVIHLHFVRLVEMDTPKRMVLVFVMRVLSYLKIFIVCKNVLKDITVTLSLENVQNVYLLVNFVLQQQSVMLAKPNFS
jgi:hypothetical protein